MPYLRLKGCSRPWASTSCEIAENVAARSVGNDPAGVEQDGARAKLEHHFEVMSGDQLGARQALNELDQPAAAARVEVGGRFVEHEYGGIAGQHAGEADAFRSPKLR